MIKPAALTRFLAIGLRSARAGSAGTSQAYVSLEELLALRSTAVDSPRQSWSSHPQSGQARSRQRGHGIEFEEVRPYSHGDDIRTIDWRLSARTGKPLTKVYAEERDQPVYIIVDQRSNMFFGSSGAFKSVTAARAAAVYSWHAHVRGERLGGMILSTQIHKIRTQRSQQSVLRFLGEVASVNAALSVESNEVLSLGDALLECRKVLPAGTRVVLISDFADLDSTGIATLRSLARHRPLQLVKVSDSLEDKMGVRGSVGVSDGDVGRRVVLTDEVVGAYCREREDRDRGLVEFVEGCGVRLDLVDEGVVF